MVIIKIRSLQNKIIGCPVIVLKPKTIIKYVLSWQCIFFLPTIRAIIDYIRKENHFIALFTINTVPKQLYREYCLAAPSEQAEGNKHDEKLSRKIQTNTNSS